MTNNIVPDYQAMAVFVRVIHCKVISPLSVLYSLKGSHHVSPHLRSEDYASLPWEAGFYINYLGIFCTGELSLLPHLLIYSPFISVWTHLSYTLGFNLIPYHLFSCTNCSSFGQREFNLGCCFPLTYLHLSVHVCVCACVHVYFIIFWLQAPWLSNIFSTSVLELAISPKVSVLLIGEGIRNYNLYAKCAHCWWIHMCVLTHVHIYIIFKYFYIYSSVSI